MFERFTDRARRVVVNAQEEARHLNHNYIGTEHVLLGLLSEGEGIAAQTLTSFDLDLDSVRGEVIKIIGQGDREPMGHIPFTPRAKKVLEYALREALSLGHGYVATEHILLGLIREGEGVGAQVLTRHHELSDYRARVIKILSEGDSPEAPKRDAQVILAKIRARLMLVEDSLTALRKQSEELSLVIGELMKEAEEEE